MNAIPTVPETPTLEELERAAWFARLAFGNLGDCVATGTHANDAAPDWFEVLP